jgi:hypothetical protein
VRDHALFYFEGYHLMPGSQQEFRQLARPWPDFEDESTFGATHRAGDVLQDAGIPEEVLAKHFARARAGKTSSSQRLLRFPAVKVG